MATVGKIEMEGFLKNNSIQSLGAGVYSFTSQDLEFHYDFSANKVNENNYPELSESQINEIISEIVEFIEDQKPDAWADSPLLPEDYYQL